MKLSRVKEIKLIFLLALSVVIFISLFTFDSGDITLLTSNPNLSRNNVVGSVGANLAWALLFLMGFGAYIIPIFMVLWGVMYFLEDQAKKLYLRIFGVIFSILAVSSILSLMGPKDIIYSFQRGGIVGLVFSDFLLKYLGTAGTFVVIVVLFLLSFLVTTDFLLFPLIGWLFKKIRSLFKKLRNTVMDSLVSGRVRKRVGESRPAILRVRQREEPKKAEPPKVQLIKTRETKEPVVKKKEKPQPKKAEDKPPVYTEPYVFPSLDLLNATVRADGAEIKENLDERSRILEETLREFGIEAKVVEVNKGPAITRYELEPASGVKVHKITALNDNIALAMKAMSVRIVAPIPGKGTVGVEVPNVKSAFVFLKEMLESKQ